MKQVSFQLKTRALAVMSAAVLLFSCNKDLPEATPIVTPPPSGSSIMSLLDAPNFSILKAAVTRAGLNTALATTSNVYTVFAPDDAAFAVSGLDLATVNALPVATLQSILSYHLVGGQVLRAANIQEKYPNMYLQSMLLLQAPSAALPPGYRMPLGISRRGGNAWANQIPVKQADVTAANGVVHVIAALLSPPAQTLGQIIMGSDPNYAFLRAAIRRADQGPPAGAPAFTPLLNNAAANFTVFAPTNTAFTNLLAALGAPADTTSFALLPSATVWGIVAFHVQGVRAFSPNLSTGGVPSIMGVNQQFNVTPTAVQVRGPGNVVPTPGGPVQFFANVTAANINSINGVIHRTDAVLMPQ